MWKEEQGEHSRNSQWQNKEQAVASVQKKHWKNKREKRKQRKRLQTTENLTTLSATPLCNEIDEQNTTQNKPQSLFLYEVKFL